jgi:hypothetical protein
LKYEFFQKAYFFVITVRFFLAIASLLMTAQSVLYLFVNQPTGVYQMRRIQLTQCVSWLAAAGVLSLSSAALSAHAADKDGAKAKPVEAELVIQSSAELSAELGKKWGRVLSEGYGVSAQGLKMFVDGYASYPQDVLKSALNAKNFETMNRTLMDHNQTLVNALAEKINNEEGTTDVEGHKVKSEVRKALGDEARDLVFIPIAPCRTFDTRTSVFSGYNGVVVPGTPKSAYVAYNVAPSAWIQYGGTVDSCPDTTLPGLLAGTYPYSVALNLTVISPVGTGWATVYRGDLSDPSLTVVSKFVQAGITDTGLVIANVCRGATGASCSNDIKIATRGTTAHVAGDVVGYFIKPQATALQCTTINSATVPLPPATNGGVTVSFPACTAGYSATGHACRHGTSADAYVSEINEIGGYCRFNYFGTAATTAQASSICCRVPGR